MKIQLNNKTPTNLAKIRRRIMFADVSASKTIFGEHTITMTRSERSRGHEKLLQDNIQSQEKSSNIS